MHASHAGRPEKLSPCDRCCRSLAPSPRRQEVMEVYQTPFIDLVHKAAVVHRMYNDPQMVS